MNKYKNLIFILFPFIVIFIYIPSVLFFYNKNEWNDDVFLVIAPAIFGILLYIFMLIVNYFFKLINYDLYKKINDHIVWLFVILGLFIFLADALAPLQLTQLDGSNIKSSEPLLISAIEFIIFIFVLIIYKLKMKFEKIIFDIVSIFSIFSFLFFIYIVSNSYLMKDKHNNNKYTNSIHKEQQNKKQSPNIYLIHLDAMQTDYFLRNLNDNNLSKYFDGFTIFKHNISNYPYTYPSVTSYLTSSTYKNLGYKTWLKTFDQGIIKDLKNNDYKINIIGKKSVFYTPKATSFVSNEEIYKEVTKIDHPLMTQFISLLTARVFPNFLTNEALLIGTKITDKFVLTANYPQTIKDGIEPFTGVQVLKFLKKSEKYRKNKNEFVLVQPILPHGPYVINKNCQYTKLDGNIASKYMQQVECATSLVIDFIDELKKLKRYNESIIFIYGDHGSGWAGLLSNSKNSYHSNIENIKYTPYDKNIHPWSKQHLESRSMALLMIKPSNSKQKLIINSFKTDLRDIYPTIFGLLKLKKNKFIEGEDLSYFLKNSKYKLKEKEHFFYYFKPGKMEKDIIYKIKVDFLNDRPTFINKKIEQLNQKQIAQKIFFSNEQISIKTKNISGIEPWGRWSDGKTVSIMFKPDKSVCEAKKLILTMKAFVTNKNKQQEADVYLNDNLIGKMEIKVGMKQPKIFTFDISNKIKCNSVNKLRFEIKNPVSPKSVGVNDDPRELGFGFVSMEFK